MTMIIIKLKILILMLRVKEQLLIPLVLIQKVCTLKLVVNQIMILTVVVEALTRMQKVQNLLHMAVARTQGGIKLQQKASILMLKDVCLEKHKQSLLELDLMLKAEEPLLAVMEVIQKDKELMLKVKILMRRVVTPGPEVVALTQRDRKMKLLQVRALLMLKVGIQEQMLLVLILKEIVQLQMEKIAMQKANQLYLEDVPLTQKAVAVKPLVITPMQKVVIVKAFP